VAPYHYLVSLFHHVAEVLLVLGPDAFVKERLWILAFVRRKINVLLKVCSCRLGVCRQRLFPVNLVFPRYLVKWKVYQDVAGRKLDLRNWYVIPVVAGAKNDYRAVSLPDDMPDVRRVKGLYPLC
jgi:hypothetical protein